MENNEIPTGHIEDVGVLNLLSAKSPADLAHIRKIEDVGVIIVPESLAAALYKIPMEDVGAIGIIPDGDNVNVIAGQTEMTGEALAKGDPNTILCIVGQLMISTVVASVGFKSIRVVGQLLAPKGSETALASAVSDLSGQVVYYPVGARFFLGHESFSREFLELLPRPTPLLILGAGVIEDDVTLELMKEKIPEIALMGNLSVPKHLAALAQVLTIQKMGSIDVRND